MALSDKHVKDICMLGCNDKQCRFLDTSDNYNSYTFQCLKKTSFKDEINKSTNTFIKDNNNKKVVGVPLGDNCKGYLPLSTLVQGYDC